MCTSRGKPVPRTVINCRAGSATAALEAIPRAPVLARRIAARCWCIPSYRYVATFIPLFASNIIIRYMIAWRLWEMAVAVAVVVVAVVVDVAGGGAVAVIVVPVVAEPTWPSSSHLSQEQHENQYQNSPSACAVALHMTAWYWC